MTLTLICNLIFVLSRTVLFCNIIINSHTNCFNFLTTWGSIQTTPKRRSPLRSLAEFRYRTLLWWSELRELPRRFEHWDDISNGRSMAKLFLLAYIRYTWNFEGTLQSKRLGSSKFSSWSFWGKRPSQYHSCLSIDIMHLFETSIPIIVLKRKSWEPKTQQQENRISGSESNFNPWKSSVFQGFLILLMAEIWRENHLGLCMKPYK